MALIKVISLYSGTGLLDCGFINQGFEIVWGCEIEPSYARAYNYALGKYIEGLKMRKEVSKNYNIYTFPDEGVNIMDVKPESITSFINGEFLGIIGGPPCQDYANGGKNMGVSGDRGRLIRDYLKKVEELRPYFFVFENVDGLITRKKHKDAVKKLIHDFQSLEYVVWYKVLNSLHYGIPQNRHRIFIVGFKKDVINKLISKGYELNVNNIGSYNDHFYSNNQGLCKKMVFRWPRREFNNQDPLKFNWPTKWPFQDKSKLDLTVSEVFCKLGIPRRAEDLCVSNAFKGLAPKTPNQQEFFNPKSPKFNLIREGDTGRKSFKRLHRFRYSPAIAYGNNEVHLHPLEPRRLTVREALRIQTAPDLFILPYDMSLTDKFKVIGNGVPVKLAELIATEVKRTINLYSSFSSLSAI